MLGKLKRISFKNRNSTDHTLFIYCILSMRQIERNFAICMNYLTNLLTKLCIRNNNLKCLIHTPYLFTTYYTMYPPKNYYFPPSSLLYNN